MSLVDPFLDSKISFNLFCLFLSWVITILMNSIFLINLLEVYFQLNTKETKLLVSKWADEMSSQFLKEEIQLLKSVQDPYLWGKDKLKLVFHITPPKSISKISGSKCWRESGKEEALFTAGVVKVSTVWKSVWRLFNKLKIELSYDLAIPPLCIYPEKLHLQIHVCCCRIYKRKEMEPVCVHTQLNMSPPTLPNCVSKTLSNI